LLVTAGTGSGYAFECYVYTHGQVRKVWEGDSFLPFEIFSTDDVASNVVVALAQPEWTEIRGKKVTIAGKAQLFLWAGDTFSSLGEAAWGDRFSVTATRAATPLRYTQQHRNFPVAGEVTKRIVFLARGVTNGADVGKLP
jgi:hypothetical protein